MGLRGPAGKRNAERVDNHSDRLNEEVVERTTISPYSPPVTEDGEPAWHPIAVELYESFERSGQSQFFQPSDWMTLFLMCESVHRDLAPQYVGMQTLPDGSTRPMKMKVPIKGASLSAYRNTLAALMATESDRRRLSMELVKNSAPEPEMTPGQTAVTDIRSRLGKKPS
jgi:hypothetical protein